MFCGFVFSLLCGGRDEGTYWSNKQLAKTAEDQNIFAYFKVNASGRKQLLVAWPPRRGARRGNASKLSLGHVRHTKTHYCSSTLIRGGWSGGWGEWGVGGGLFFRRDTN